MNMNYLSYCLTYSAAITAVSLGLGMCFVEPRLLIILMFGTAIIAPVLYFQDHDDSDEDSWL